jgi:hypothetical protein
MLASYTLTACLSILQVGAQLKYGETKIIIVLVMCALQIMQFVIVNKSVGY